MKRKFIWRVLAMTMIFTMVLLSMPAGSLTYAGSTPEGTVVTVKIPARAEMVLEYLDEYGEPIVGRTVTVLGSDTHYILEADLGENVRIKFNDEGSGTAFGDIKFRYQGSSTFHYVISPFTFVVGENTDGRMIDYITSWKEIEAYDVSFFGVDQVNPFYVDENVLPGEDAEAPAPGDVPTEEGKYFVEWDKSFTNVRSDLNVYAIYDWYTYDVRFFGTDLVNPLSVDYDVRYGTSATAPLFVPEPVGEHFTGWDKTFNFITSDLDVFAQYETNTYTVTFYDGLYVYDTDYNVPYGTAADTPAEDPNHEAEGKRFIGWSPDYSNITSDLSVFAQYEDITYTVTFMDGSDVFDVQYNIPHGGSATAPTPQPDHESDGKRFEGWSPSYSNITEDTIVYAQYSDITYTVTFYDGFGVFDVQYDISHGGSAETPDPSPDYTNIGLDFTGWDKLYNNITSDLSVFAVYDGITYTVTFMDGEDVFDVQYNIPHGGSATAPFPEPNHEPDGKRFEGWSPSYSNITEDTTVYAQYSDITYTVTFYDGTEVFDIQYEISHGGSAETPDPEPNHEAEGKNFTGWSPDYSNITSDLSVYAQYDDITYTVTFMDGEEVFDIQYNIPHGGNAELPVPSPNHEAEGKRFTGWEPTYMNIVQNTIVYAQYEDIYYTVTFYDGTEVFDIQYEIIHGGSATTPETEPNHEAEGKRFTGWSPDYSNITSDLSVYAQYDDITYTVTFMDGGEVFDIQYDIPHGGSAILPVPSPNHEADGKRFTGWEPTYMNIVQDTIVYAQYEDIYYVVSFFGFGSDEPFYADDAVLHGTAATPPTSIPEPDGHHFDRWDVAFNNVTSDMEVNAIYEMDVYTVTFVVPEGAPVAPDAQQVEYNNFASEPIYGDGWEGNQFNGWFLGGNEVPFDFENTGITGNITLVANWEGIEMYTVTFHPTNGEDAFSETVYAGESVAEPVEDPQRTSYTFEGWTGTYVFGTPIDADHDMYAEWTRDSYTVIFNENGGTAVNDQNVLSGEFATQPSITRTDHTFLRWELNGSTYNFNTPVTSNITLDAKWSYNYVPPADPYIRLDRNYVELEYGTEALEEFFSYDFTETIYNSSDRRVEWYVGDDEIISVDQNGLVEAVSEGETTVTVRHIASGATDTATVVVFLVGDEITPLGAIEFYSPYVFGYPDTTFGPSRPVTRAEIATMFAKILNMNFDYPGTPKFNDVNKDAWYYTYVQAIGRTGIFVGTGDGKFMPDEPISRSELATVFAKFLMYSEIDVDMTPVTAIKDVTGSHWASPYIYSMYNSGLMVGYPDGTYKPDELTQRDHAVTMINKLISRPQFRPAFTKYIDIDTEFWAFGDIEAATTPFTVQQELPVEEEDE
jgi:hypothetical protein